MSRAMGKTLARKKAHNNDLNFRLARDLVVRFETEANLCPASCVKNILIFLRHGLEMKKKLNNWYRIKVRNPQTREHKMLLKPVKNNTYNKTFKN